MEEDFSQLFHHSSKNGSKGHPLISSNPTEWPEEWKTTYYKDYLRMPKIALEKGDLQADFSKLIENRKSRINFCRGDISKRQLSAFLQYSCGNTSHMGDGRYRRAQASGGARYPIEVYILVFRNGSDLDSGLYHYNVKNHALDVLLPKEFSDEDIDRLFSYPWTKNASIGVVMTAVFWRNQNKYGERGYRYILLEAGHIGQNMYLAAEALGAKSCVAGTRDENIEKLIDIDGISESVVYGFALGT